MLILAAALLLAASPAPAPQGASQAVSCNLTIGRTLHTGDCTLRRISASREELRGGNLRLEIVYRTRGGARQEVLLNGHPGAQNHTNSGNLPVVSGITEDAYGPSSIAYSWWTQRTPTSPEPDSQEPSGW